MAIRYHRDVAIFVMDKSFCLYKLQFDHHIFPFLGQEFCQNVTQIVYEKQIQKLLMKFVIKYKFHYDYICNYNGNLCSITITCTLFKVLMILSAFSN